MKNAKKTVFLTELIERKHRFNLQHRRSDFDDDDDDDEDR